MPTVIDALIVQLDLDPSNFTKGQKEAAASFLKTKDAARKAASDTEEAAKKMNAAIGKATDGVLNLAAAFLGGVGIKEFLRNAQRSETSLGNLSTNLGVSTQFLSAWGIAAQRAGGSAAATQASLANLSNALVDLKTFGKNMPDAFWMLQAKSGVKLELNKGVDELAISLAKAGHEMAKTNPAQASRFLQSLGIDPATAALMIRQGERLRQWIAMQKRLAPSKEDVAAAEKLTDATGELRAQYDLLAAKVLTALTPALTSLASVLGTVVEAFAKFAEANPNFTTGLTAIFALVAGAKIISAVKNILGLRAAILALGEANASFSITGGLFGWLAANPWVAGIIAGGYVALHPDPANADEDERARQEKYGQHGNGGGRGNAMLRQRARGGRGGSDGAPLNATTGGMSRDEMAAYIRESAIKRGIDPDIALRVARSEGLNVYAGDGSGKLASSFGPFQLHYGGINPAMPHPGLGDAFTKATGLDARNPSTVRQQIDFALNQVRAQGWGPWSGARNQGILGFRGVGPLPAGDDYSAHRGGKVPMPANMPLWHGSDAARAHTVNAAALNRISNSYQASTTSTSNEAHIGTINVHAGSATDAHGIAGHIDEALAQRLFSQTPNYGQY